MVVAADGAAEVISSDSDSVQEVILFFEQGVAGSISLQRTAGKGKRAIHKLPKCNCSSSFQSCETQKRTRGQRSCREEASGDKAEERRWTSFFPKGGFATICVQVQSLFNARFRLSKRFF